MKQLLLILFLVGNFVVKAQEQKPENLSDLKNNPNIYSSIVAKDISKNIGANLDTEKKIEAIYIQYQQDLRTSRLENQENPQKKQIELEKSREEKISSLLTDKQKEKYKIYTESKK